MPSTRILQSLTLCVFLVIPCGTLFADSDPTMLTGEFLWRNRDHEGDLEATFRPASEGQWEVAFQFTFRGKEHVYTGTAEGSLENGSLGGRVENENGERTWLFQGDVRDGTFTGTHEETTPGRENEGTLTLRPSPVAEVL